MSSVVKRLAQILPMQKNDFREIFRIMEGLPVTVRLTDPPLHEFLPQEDLQIGVLAAYVRSRQPEAVRERVEKLHESNPIWDIAVGWALPLRTSITCRYRPLWRRPVSCTGKGSKSTPRSWCRCGACERASRLSNGIFRKPLSVSCVKSACVSTT